MSSTRPLVVRLMFVFCVIVVGFADQSDIGAEVPAESSTSELNHAVNEMISRDYPSAKVVEIADVDVKSCGVPPNHPGWVKADFNGDGQLDHAVLLMVGEPEKGPQRVAVHFVIFVREKDGSYKRIAIRSFEGRLPVGKLIQEQPPRKVQESAVLGKRVITLRNSGIALVSCEQYAQVYYWNTLTNQIDLIGTAD